MSSLKVSGPYVSAGRTHVPNTSHLRLLIVLLLNMSELSEWLDRNTLKVIFINTQSRGQHSAVTCDLSTLHAELCNSNFAGMCLNENFTQCI